MENTTAMQLILQERQRQIDSEGYSSLHDSQYNNDELLRAANCYFNNDTQRYLNNESKDNPPLSWPWDKKYWKPTPNDRVRELVKAGALYKADYDLNNRQLSYEKMELCAKKINELTKPQP